MGACDQDRRECHEATHAPQQLPLLFNHLGAGGQRRWDGHRTGMHRVKAGRSFAVRKLSPTFRFAEPLPTVLDIERRALAT
jgi:hypothetical protein